MNIANIIIVLSEKGRVITRGGEAPSRLNPPFLPEYFQSPPMVLAGKGDRGIDEKYQPNANSTGKNIT
jgi:hypothetical protein